MRLFSSQEKSEVMFAQQVRGTVTVCVGLALIPLFLFLTSRLPVNDIPVWANSSPDLSVVEVIDAADAAGIYYVPPATSACRLLGDIGLHCDPQDNFTIKNGTSLRVTPGGTVVAQQMKAAQRLALGLPLDVNLARDEDLILIPGIGQKTSALIVKYRKEKGRIQNLGRLREIRGIGEKKLSHLKKYLYVEE